MSIACSKAPKTTFSSHSVQVSTYYQKSCTLASKEVSTLVIQLN